MTNTIFDCCRSKIELMTTAGLASVYWRQDKYQTDGIVESDERVDGGRKLYWPHCWPRSFIVEPLLAAGEFERVRRYLLFWKKCQRADGCWLHCYDVRNYKEYPGLPETDNVGYMLWHIYNYVSGAGDRGFLAEHWQMVASAVKFLQGKFNGKLNLIDGIEEAEIPGCSDFASIRYSTHINVICSLGLLCASRLAQLIDQNELSEKWCLLAETIQSEGIEKQLWDEKEKTFLFGITGQGKRLTAPLLWLTLIPYFVSNRWDDRIENTLSYIDRRLYDKDPKIKNTYWMYDYSPVLQKGNYIENKYSGAGVHIGGLPVLIDVCLKKNIRKKAEEQLLKLVEYTNPENNLVPEHVNTLSAGKLGNYSVYPEPYYYVDSGNLMHLSFFLTLVARQDRNLLIESTAKADKLNGMELTRNKPLWV